MKYLKTQSNPACVHEAMFVYLCVSTAPCISCLELISCQLLTASVFQIPWDFKECDLILMLFCALRFPPLYLLLGRVLLL